MVEKREVLFTIGEVGEILGSKAEGDPRFHRTSVTGVSIDSRTVKESDATFRILIGPTPLVGPDRANKNDSYANKGFAYEGDEIRKFIGDQKNMYVICGDRHWQYVSVDVKTRVREYACGPSSDAHAGGFDESLRTPMHQYLRIKGGFLMVTVERTNGEPAITFRHYGTDGKIHHEDRILHR